MDEVKVCADCGAVIDGEAIEIDGEYYCPDCIDDNWCKCSNCGEWVKANEVIICEGYDYCERCAEECLSWCDHCEEYHRNEDVEEVHIDLHHRVYRCNCCRDWDVFRCESCGDWWSTDNDYIIARGGVDICPNCRDDYYYCEQCGEYVYYDEWDSDEECCCDCATGSGLIKQYHDKPLIEYVGECRKVWHGVWRGVGVELEIDREYNNKDEETATAESIQDIAGEAIYFNRDGSLNNGFEIITQPHTEAAFWAIDWEAILNTCKQHGYTSHDAGTCGLHLHISREMFGCTEDRQGVAISKLIRFYDLFYIEILKVSRRTAGQANQWAAAYNTQNRKQAEAYGKKKNNAGRYYAINNTNRNTVEIRITRGTLNYSTFAACIDFMLTVAKNSRRIAWAKVTSPAEWLRGLKPETINYLKERKAFEEVL